MDFVVTVNRRVHWLIDVETADDVISTSLKYYTNSNQAFDASLKLADRITHIAYNNGVIFRTFADHTVGLAPALCFTTDEFDILFERIGKTLDTVLEDAAVRKLVK